MAAAAAALTSTSGRRDPAPFSLAYLSDPRHSRNNGAHPIQAVIRVLPENSAFIFRHYHHAQRRRAGRALRALCNARKVAFFYAAATIDDVGFAQEIGADGIHLPARWLKTSTPLTWPETLLATAACHDAAELSEAARLGVDAAFLSPVFPTASHLNAAGLGAQCFNALAAASALPVLALGGVNERNAAMLTGVNVVGLGAIGAFARAPA